MSTVVGLFDILDNSVTIYHQKDNNKNFECTGKIDATTSSSTLIEMANVYNANKIHVFGPEDYLEPIVKNMYAINFNFITIEVN